MGRCPSPTRSRHHRPDRGDLLDSLGLRTLRPLPGDTAASSCALPLGFTGSHSFRFALSRYAHAPSTFPKDAFWVHRNKATTAAHPPLLVSSARPFKSCVSWFIPSLPFSTALVSSCFIITMTRFSVFSRPACAQLATQLPVGFPGLHRGRAKHLTRGAQPYTTAFNRCLRFIYLCFPATPASQVILGIL